MSEPLKLRPINNAELAAKGVVALADRPNTRAQYGVGGLTAPELKRWFDNLSVFLAGKINELQNAFCSEEGADYIPLKTPIVDKQNDIDIRTLGDIIHAYGSGVFASHMIQAALPGFIDGNAMLQYILDKIAVEIGENNRDIDTLLRSAGVSINGDLDTGTQIITIQLLNAQRNVISSYNLDLRVATARIIDRAVTGPKIADYAVTENKIGNEAVTEPKLANHAVTENKIANGAVSENKLAPKHLRRVQALEAGAFKDATYKAETGELVFTSSTGAQKSINLPVSEILVDAYFSEGTPDEDEDDALVLVFVNGLTVRIPSDALLSSVFTEVQEMLDSVYALQKAPPISQLNKSILLATPTLAQIVAEQEGAF